MNTITRSCKKRQRESDIHSFIDERTKFAKTFDVATWVSASSVANFYLNDPFLDWVKYHQSQQKSPHGNDFVHFLFAKGIEFEQRVMHFLRNTLGQDKFVTVCHSHEDILLDEKYSETIDHMRNGVPVIYQGVVRNPENQTFGSPDLIVRADYLNKLVHEKVISSPEGKIPSEIGDYHYRIVDIKFCTLKLRSNGEHLLNAGRLAANKAQVLIYTLALGYMQGVVPPEGYLLGRGWNYFQRGVKYFSRRCNSKLGRIHLSQDQQHLAKLPTAIEWVQRVKKDGKNWVVTPHPSVEELYPNMCNQYDFPYREYKRQVAEELNEISLIWQCGVTHRKNCLEKGIKSWKDVNCNVDSLGMTGPVRKRIVQDILDINRSDRVMSHTSIENNDGDWQIRKRLEFYIDFENATTLFDDFAQLPYINSQTNVVCLIGLGWVVDGSWNYIYFLAEELSPESELDMFRRFDQFVQDKCREFDAIDPPFYHWSHAEPTLYNQFLDRNEGYHATPPNFQDFLKVIKAEVILFKGVFNFSLKSYGKAMGRLGLISEVWDEDVHDGLSAMLQMYEYYQGKREIGPILKYNEMDCKMIYCIVRYLRGVGEEVVVVKKEMTEWE